MGAYAPTPFVDKKVIDFVSEKIIRPTLDAMKKEGKTVQWLSLLRNNAYS